MNEIRIKPNPSPLIQWGRKKNEYYNGIKIKADKNIHTHIISFLEYHNIQIQGSNIIDIGCGEGALSQRLADNGAIVQSVDMDEGSFRASTKFEKVDFNSSEEVRQFIERNKHKYDLCIATEVIEHVRNPWDLLTTMRALVKDKGFAIVTTPNTGSVLSRLQFLRTGNIFQFEKNDLNYGHITPISLIKILQIAEDTAWRIKSWTPGGNLPKIWLGFRAKYVIYSIFSVLFRCVMKGTKNGWCLLFLMSPKRK